MAVQLVMYDEEHRQIVEVCETLCREANARVVFVIDKNGQLLASGGDTSRLDSTSLASLVAGEIAATGGLAKLMGEKEFSTLFHEGVRDHIHISLVASRVILVVIFDSRSSLGLVRLRVRKQSERLGGIVKALVERSADRPSPLAEITDEDIDNLFSV
jgi:predicted regulator of Ras-like GTPase activity (Roadblock/LC7/MglB family)